MYEKPIRVCRGVHEHHTRRDGKPDVKERERCIQGIRKICFAKERDHQEIV